jgi:hypothetical protein
MKMHDVVAFLKDTLPQAGNFSQIQIVAHDERNGLNV